MFIAQVTEHEVCHGNTDQNECSEITDCLIFLQFLYYLALRGVSCNVGFFFVHEIIRPNGQKRGITLKSR